MYYSIGDCGGNYSGQESDVITSPNYPGTIQTNVCIKRTKPFSVYGLLFV